MLFTKKYIQTLSSTDKEEGSVDINIDDVLNEIGVDYCIDFYGSKKVMNAIDIEDFIKHRGRTEILSNFDLGEKLYEESIDNVITHYGGESIVLDEIGEEKIVKHFGPDIIKLFTKEELIEKMYEALDSVELMEMAIDFLKRRER